MLTLLLLAGCGGNGLDVRNNEPEATILAPVPDATLVEGHAATLLGSVSDTNHPPAHLLATWLAGDAELCPAAPVADDGSTTCDFVVEAAHTELTLLVVDPEGAEGVAVVEVVTRPNGAPVVTLALPDGAGPYPADTYVVVEGLVSDTEDAPADLTLAWTDGDGAPLPLDPAVDTDGGLSGALLLGAGTHTITLTATDTVGAAGSDTIQVELE